MNTFLIIFLSFLQILKYLVASDRLCELGYDEAQVEEALEMFQNCESKVILAHHSLPQPYVIRNLNVYYYLL